MKDLIILYKVYLQTLLNIRDGNEVKGDRDTLKILRKELDEACLRKKKVDIHEECWDLSYTFIRWLNDHLRVYKEDASKVIKMDFHKFDYEGRDVPFDYLLDKLIEMTGLFIDIQDDHWCDERLEGLKEEIMYIFNMIFWHLWW